MQSSPCLSRAASVLRRALAPALVVAIVALGALGSCNDNGTIDPNIPSILIVVNVQGVLPDVASLEVRASLNGKTDPLGLNITNNTSQFALTLPNTPQSLGSLRIDAFGLDPNKCYQISGSVTTQLAAGTIYQELTLMLQSAGSRLCQLVVDLTGSGTVTSTPLGISCGGGNNVCTFGFPYGQAVTLSGAISAQSYPVWSSNCVSGGAQSPSCKIAMLAQGEQHVAASFVPRSCTPGGFCQYNPLPAYFTINSLWGTGAKDVWAVGGLPASILHYDGTAWTVSPNPSLGPLAKVWGTGPSDVWALGSNTLLRYNGAKWTSVSGSTLTSFSAGFSTSPTNVWVAGDTGQVARFDGSKWTTAFPAPEVLNSLWASSPTDLWGLGASGSAYHYNGQAIAKDPSATLAGKVLVSLWGSSATSVWAASATEVFHFDGTAWLAQPAELGVTLSGLGGIGGFGGPDAWFAATTGRILHNKGTPDCLGSKSCWTLAVSPSLPSTTLRAVWGNSATDIWVAGDFPGIVHFDGQQWRLDPSVSGTTPNLLGVWTPTVGINAGSVVSGLATNQVLAYDGAVGITGSATLSAGLNSIYGVTVSGTTEIWAAGGLNTLLRSTDGKTFASVSAAVAAAPATLHTVLNGVFMTATSAATRNYFVVGDTGYIGHWDGAAWTTVTGCPLTATLRSIHGNASGSILYAVGANGALYSINATANTCTVPLTTPPTTNFNSVFFDGTTAWLAGDGGVVAQYTPAAKTLTAVTSGTTANLNAIWAGGNKNPVWAVGASGTILSCDPSTLACAVQPTGLSTNLRGVWGANVTDIWVVGNTGTMLRLKM